MIIAKMIQALNIKENHTILTLGSGIGYTSIMAEKISSLEKSKMTQPEDIAEICSTILKLPMQSVPFEISLNCNYEI